VTSPTRCCAHLCLATRAFLPWQRRGGSDGASPSGIETAPTPRQPASEIYVNNNRWEPGIYGYWNGLRPTEFNGNVDDVRANRSTRGLMWVQRPS
jgi:hypothetical protein